ncbi:MAG: hypothetical protein MdMp014T_0643 [Treponematales bacterium]
MKKCFVVIAALATLLTGCATTAAQLRENHTHRFVILDGSFAPVGSGKKYDYPAVARVKSVDGAFDFFKQEGKEVHEWKDGDFGRNSGKVKEFVRKSGFDRFDKFLVWAFWDSENYTEDLIHLPNKAKMYGFQLDKEHYLVIEVSN